MTTKEEVKPYEKSFINVKNLKWIQSREEMGVRKFGPPLWDEKPNNYAWKSFKLGFPWGK